MIGALVQRLDRKAQKLQVVETDLDIKIHLKTPGSGRPITLPIQMANSYKLYVILGEIFTKDQGIKLFVKEMGLNLREGNILICADAEADIPMLEMALRLNPANTYVVWLQRDVGVKQKVTELCAKYDNHKLVFVAHPDSIIGAMALAATSREPKMRTPPEEMEPIDLPIT